jgi:guanylate kinase
MQGKKEALVIIVSAPSGSGKTTIVKMLQEKMPEVRRSISCTTRQPREDETDGEDYLFISEEEFREKAEAGEFLEWEENFGNCYGTPRAQLTEALETGQDIILSIDVKGARTVKIEVPESISVFVMPPSPGELEERLRKRNTDHESQVETRLKESKREIAAADEYDYLIVNKDLAKAVEELKDIIDKERSNRKQMEEKREEQWKKCQETD